MSFSLPARAALLAALCLSLAAAPARPARRGPGVGVALEAASRSVVRVDATFASETTPSPAVRTFSNIGFLVGPEGEVLTSLFGLTACSRIVVVCPDGRRASARVVAIDQPTGLALIKAELEETSSLEFAEEPLSVGSLVLLPYFHGVRAAGVALDSGVVASTDAAVRLSGVEWEGLVTVGLDMRTGGAAAPLLDAQGRLAGVVLGVRGRAVGGTECFVLPAAALSPVLEQLKGGDSRRLGWLGVAIVQEPGKTEGVRVEIVLEGSPAHSADIQPGDVLLQVDGITIDSPAVLSRHVVEVGPERTVELKALRGDKILTVPVEVGARPLLIWRDSRPLERDLRTMRRLRQAEEPSAEVNRLLEENRRLKERVEQLEERLRLLKAERDR